MLMVLRSNTLKGPNASWMELGALEAADPLSKVFQ